MVKVLVVAGWDRSGSTVLSEVLGSADHVVSVGEVNNLWERGFALDHRCGCGLRFSECELWSDVTAKAFGGDRAAALDRARRASEGLGNGWLLLSRLPFVGRRLARRGDGYADLLGEVYRAIAEVSGARLIVDSSKTPWHAALAARAAGAEVSVVHLVRDPRGVVNSLRKHVLYEKDPERDTYMDRHGAAFATAAWSFRTWLIDRMWRSSPAFASVRYEDFVAAPEATVTAVLPLGRGAGPHRRLLRPRRGRCALAATASPATRCASATARCVSSPTRHGAPRFRPPRSGWSTCSPGPCWLDTAIGGVRPS